MYVGMDLNEESTVTSHPLAMSLTPPESPAQDNLRVLARSESFANDACIVDKLQAVRKHCARTLDFQEEAENDDSRSSPTKYGFVVLNVFDVVLNLGQD